MSTDGQRQLRDGMVEDLGADHLGLDPIDG